MAFSTMFKMRGAPGLMLCGLTACQMTNPAFGDDAADGDTGESDVDQSTSTESGGSSSSDGDGDGESESDTQESDTSSESDTGDVDTGTPGDMAVESCDLGFSDPFAPIYGTPDAFGGFCPQAVSDAWVLVTAPGPQPGLVLGQGCGEGCEGCDGEAFPIGVPGLDGFSTPIALAVDNDQFVCMQVQTGLLDQVDDLGRCMYASIYVSEGGVHKLLALHESGPLPPGGSVMIANNPLPGSGQLHESCSCEGLYDPMSADLDCCLEAGASPFVNSLVFLGADVFPPGSAIVVMLQVEWVFHVAQAELRASCDAQNGTEVSWALVRKN